jgi:hypothetical protein
VLGSAKPISNGNIVYLGIRSDGIEANKNKLLSILISAQITGESVQIYWYRDTYADPILERGNDVIRTLGVQSISLISESN